MAYVDHVAHGGWSRVAPCVYCSCGRRLYQGRLPGSESEGRELMEAFDEMVKGVRKRMSDRVDAVTLDDA